MHAPTRELLNQDIAYLDVPAPPKATLNSALETGAYAPVAFPPPVQGMIEPVLNPDVIDQQYCEQPAGF